MYRRTKVNCAFEPFHADKMMLTEPGVNRIKSSLSHILLFVRPSQVAFNKPMAIAAVAETVGGLKKSRSEH